MASSTRWTPPHLVRRVCSSGPLLVMLVICAVMFALPVVMVAIGAFRTDAPGTPGNHWSLHAIGAVYGHSGSWVLLRNSVAFAVGVSACSTLLASYLAWLGARTDTPLRSWLAPVMVTVLVMPQLFFAIGWSLLGNKQVGGINKVLDHLFSSDMHPINVETWVGLVFVATIKSTALKYMLLRGPMGAMDLSQEEAAFMAGASKLRTFLTITIPALAPAITGAFVLGVVVALEYFDIPLILGSSANLDVFSTQIYGELFQHEPPLFSNASALALGAIAVLLILLLLQGRLLSGRQFTTVRGKTSRQGLWRLGGWRYVGAAVIALYALLAVVLPVGQLVVVSLTPFLGVYEHLGFANYTTVMHDRTVVSGIHKTIELSVGAGAVAVVLALAISYFARHHRGIGPRLLSVSTWLPWSVPGTALGLGMLWAYLEVPGLSHLYGTAALVLIGLVVAATPLAMRTVEPAVSQIGAELEEAARVAGAGRLRGFGHAIVRLVTPSLVSGWVLAAILVAGNLVIPLMLGSANAKTLPALVYQRYSTGKVAEAAALLCLLLAGIAVLGAAAVVVRAAALLIARRRRRAVPPEVSASSTPFARTTSPQPAALRAAGTTQN